MPSPPSFDGKPHGDTASVGSTIDFFGVPFPIGFANVTVDALDDFGDTSSRMESNTSTGVDVSNFSRQLAARLLARRGDLRNGDLGGMGAMFDSSCWIRRDVSDKICLREEVEDAMVGFC